MEEKSKIEIIYFSPTNNGKSVAEFLASNLHDFSCDLKNITPYSNRKKEGLITHQNFVFISPIYAHCLLPDIITFLKDCKVEKENKAVFICCYGNISYGSAVKRIVRICKYLNINLQALIMLPSKHGYSGKSIKPANIFEDIKTKDIVASIASAIFCDKEIDKNCSNNKICNIKKLPQKIRPKLYRAKFNQCLDDLTVKIVKNNACVSCGKCIKECPNQAISDLLVIDNQKCLRCGRCVMVCPKHALNIKFFSFIPKVYLNIKIDQPKKADIFINH